MEGLTLKQSQERYKKSILEREAALRNKALTKEAYEPGEVEEILEEATESLGEDAVKGIKEELPLSRFTVLSLEELRNYEHPNYTWRVQNLIQDKKTIILGGPSAVFKSWLALNLAVSISKGMPFLGNFAVEQGAVLFIDRENSIPELQNRVEMIMVGMGLDPSEKLPLYFISEQSLKLDTGEGVDYIKDLLIEKQIKLVISDTYRRVISFEENDANSVSYFFTDCIKPICEETGASFVFIHHHKKGKAESDEKELLRGSSDLVNFVDGIIQMNRKGNRIIVRQTKNRSGREIEPFELIVETDEEEYFKFNYQGVKQDTSKLAQAVEVLCVWLAETKVQEFETSDAQKHCFAKNIKRRKFFESLEELVKRGILENISRGKYKVLNLDNKSADLELVPSSPYIRGELGNFKTPKKSPSSQSANALKELKELEKSGKSTKSKRTKGTIGLSKKRVIKKKLKEKIDRQKQFWESDETVDIKTVCTKEQVLNWIKDNPGKSYKDLYEVMGTGSLRLKNELIAEGLIVSKGNKLEVTNDKS
jgi:hypothetical protein